MKNLNIKILLVLMILLSLFSGITINGMSGAIYTFELISFPDMLRYEVILRDLVLWIITILSHVGIVALPLFVERPYFKKLLICFPVIYLVGYFFLILPYFILLMPFMFFWLVSLYMARKINK